MEQQQGPVMLGTLAAPPREQLFGSRYRADRMVHDGRFARTFHGTDLSTGEQVVIKTTPADRLPAAAALRLEHEAAVLARLEAPELASLLAVGREADVVYLVTPFVPGASLEARLRHGPLAVHEALTVARAIMRALAHIHAHDIVHGDVKPANVIVEGEATVEGAVLIDFGLARSAALDDGVRDRPAGTARYVSPEQAGLLDHRVDERSDLYSAGILLFECLAGRPPFEAGTVGALLRQHLSVSPPALRSLGIAVPAALDELVQRLIRKDPRDRYQSAVGALADLVEIAEAVRRGAHDPSIVIGLHDRRRTLTEPAFVGRSEDLAVLEAQLARAADGQGGLALVEGESGGGKTRLLDEFARRCAARGVWVLRGQGLGQAAHAPLQMLNGVVEAVTAAAAADPDFAAATRDELGQHVDAACQALPQLAAVLRGGGGGLLGPEDFGERRTLDALSVLLYALGSVQRPCVVLLDDCQWADELTVKLLHRWWRAAAETTRHVSVVVAFRCEEVSEDHALRRLDPAAHVRLRPFDSSDVQQLVESMGGQVPAPAVELVRRLSDGNPFMASAVLRGLVESGALIDAADGWRFEHEDTADVQSSREAARFLTRRLELLPAAALDLLSVGAVLGKDFDIGLAADLAEQRPHDMMVGLHEARRRHIVWAELQDNRCSFVHDKLREALLDRLDDVHRRELHGLAARRLEQLGASRAFDLAYHFDAAGEHERALPHALAAGAEARGQHALEVAEQQYRIALRGSVDADDVVRRGTLEELGAVLMLRGRYDEAADRLSEAVSLAPDDLTRAQIEARLGELAFKRGDVGAGVEALERGLRLLQQRAPRRKASLVAWLLWEVIVQALHTALPRVFLGRRRGEPSGTDLLAIRIYSRLAYAYWFGRGKVACGWAHLREMNLAERHPPGPPLAQAYSEHAPVMTVVPLFRRGIAYGQRSLDIRRAAGDRWGEGQSLGFCGAGLYAASRFREAMAQCIEAAHLLEQTGDRWEVNTASWHVAYCLYRLGDLDAAVEAARDVHRAGVEIGDAQATGISLSAWAKASGGQVPQDLIDAELARGGDDGHTAVEVQQAHAIGLLRRGRPDEAAAVLTDARRLLQTKGLRQEYVAPVLPWLATALRHQAMATNDLTPGRRRRLLREARGATRRACRLARWYRNNLPHALREAGLVAALRGRPWLARRHLGRSLAVAQRQSAGWEQVQTLLARAQVGREMGWTTAGEDLEAATAAMCDAYRDASVEHLPFPAEPPADRSDDRTTLSLADRFDTVLEAGRRIASALTRDAIFAAVRDAARILLRGERCVVLEVHDGSGDGATAVSSELDGELDELCRQLVRQVVTSKRAAALGGEAEANGMGELMTASHTRSALCAPVLVRERVVGSFYVSHGQVSDLFGREEERLAEFIATLAGAALENAEGFAGVQALTKTLEQRVEERTAQLATANRELAHQAFHDPLTKLANRVLFHDRVEHAIARRQRTAKPLAVLLVDLDDFKNVNDTWGHPAGDELLIGVGERLRRRLRPADTVARLGGDEFGVLLEDAEEAMGAVAVAERIVRDLADPFQLRDTTVRIHASIGIALGDGDRGDAEELFRRADAAMYAAKERGKDCVAVFEPPMLAAVVTRGQLRADLQRAVEHQCEQEFVVHYQPIVELGSGRLTSVEALVRWHRPGRPPTAPGEFIPLAEEAGFIIPIGGWILARACRQVAAWQRAASAGEPLGLHVNLSARQLQDAQLVGDVTELLAATGLAGGSLVLEITESGIMHDPEAAARTVHALRELGVRVALDDFGTGYSSLGYLQRFPIDILKIDKCFVDGLGTGVAASALSGAIVQLGRTLGLVVVAEGVEHTAQAAELHALGCHFGQGFFWGRAEAAEDLEQRVRAHRSLPTQPRSLAPGR